MSSGESRARLNLSLPPDVHEILQAAARQHARKPTTLAAQIVTHALTGQLPGTPGQLALDTSAPSQPPATPQPAAQPSQRAAWLELGRGRAWRKEMWRDAQQLRHWYPDLAAVLPAGWVHDRFARDGLFALAAWRRDLDTGVHTDPRHEHHWLNALRDFKQMMSDRAPQVGTRTPTENPPEGW